MARSDHPEGSPGGAGIPARQGGRIRIAPSLLSADFSRLGEEIASVEAAGADLLHLDVMDGHFVPNLSIGVPVVESISRCTDLLLDTHLMITDPGRYAEAFALAGAGNITFHIEVAEEPRALVRQIHDLGVKAGVALNPGTPAQRIDGIIEDVDVVLVMTVWPGFGGQEFISDCLAKIETLAGRLRPDQWLEVDGGINRRTAGAVAAAGADTLVAGNAVFASPDAGVEVRELRKIACGAAATRMESSP
jgi:ribulose-phosphate 3-epimerase